MELNLILDANKIYKKEFEGNKPGYDALQVDSFLDLVIKDYTEFNSTIKKLLKDNRILEDEIAKLKQEIRRLKDTEEIVESSTSRITNLDILKRLSSLEKTVYGKNTDI